RVAPILACGFVARRLQPHGGAAPSSRLATGQIGRNERHRIYASDHLVHVFINTMMYFYCNMFPMPSCCLPQTGGSLCQEQALLRLNSAAKSERFCNTEPPNIHHRIVKWSAPKSSSSLPKEPRTSISPNPCPFPLRSCVAGESDSSRNAWPVWTSAHGEADLAFFPPHLVMEVK